ncbi:MAG: hypothetical protein IKW01_05600 [Firmicutes bacterium]|nr:hypothetical protein [Bacillota bacterium]
MKWLKDNLLFLFFTIVYFRIAVFVVNRIMENTIFKIMGIVPLASIITIVCWFIAFVICIGLADYTVKKIEKKYSKK